nr:site-specific integrase [Methylocystis sp. ATCC 49242]
MGRLTARKVQTAGPGLYPDGGGLYLCVSESGRKTWVFRFSFRGRRPEMGLGSFDEGVTLAEARGARDEARRILRSGRNPIEVRREARRASEAKPTFGEIADRFIESKAIQWGSEKHRDQWRQALSHIAAPLRQIPVDEVDTGAILAVLTPMWHATPETASRLRGRIESVLDAAKAQGLRSGENPARWRGHLAHLLPKRGRLARAHHAALPYEDVPAFVVKLRDRESVAALALEFAILTAARSGEVLGAQWSEIDTAGRVWTIPAERMKAGREHRVPLSGRALEILEKLSATQIGSHVFPGRARGGAMCHAAMWNLVKQIGDTDVTVHGFRSAFRDWAGNETNFPREVAEAALAHVVGDKAEQAYRRGDALEKRRALMETWASYIEPKAAGGADILQFKVTRE